MKDEFNQDGWVRRVDLLLRARYPELKTRIFNLDGCYHQIYCIKISDKEFQEIEPIFDREIRFVTLAVKLTNKLPKNYKEELRIIEDSELGSFEGLCMTVNDLLDTIEGKFAVRIVKYENTSSCKIYINIDDKKNIANIQDFVDSLKLVRYLKVEPLSSYKTGEIIAKPEADNKDVHRIIPSIRRTNKMPFLRRDEELWFDNVQNIFSGELTKNDLFFYDCENTNCYLNFVAFDNINLRNNIMLYDTIYISPPLAESMPKFWNDQKIKEDAFLNVVEKGQIKLLLDQPEERLDKNFLMKIYERNKKAIISRRAIASLLAIDMVEIHNNYLFAQSKSQEFALKNISKISQLFNVPEQFLTNTIFWPTQAIRSCMEILHKRSITSVNLYGINNLIVSQIKESNISQKRKNDLAFEYMVNAQFAHLAHALNAHYYSFKAKNNIYTNEPFVNQMGHLLNFYKHFNANQIINYERIKENEKFGKLVPVAPISFFEVNKFVPLDEFSGVFGGNLLGCGRKNKKIMRSLLSELANLDDISERRQLISIYNTTIDSELKNKKVGKIMAQAIFTWMSCAHSYLTIPSIILGWVVKNIDKFPILEATNSKESKIKLLSRTNRAVKLKTID